MPSQAHETESTLMQAIETKFIGPTNELGSRIRARAATGRLLVGYNHGLNLEDNHRAAAEALRHKLGWTKAKGYKFELHTGTLASGDYVHVFVKV